MFSIPHTFVNPAEDYITLPALKRFVKELENDELRTTIDRPAIIKEIEDFANQSPENEELVLEWLDQVVVEGIKDIQIKYLNSESYTSVLDDDNLIMGILEPKIICQDKRHVNGVYDKELSLLNYKIVNDSKTGKSIKLYLGKLLNTFYKGVSNAVIYYPIFIELYIDIGIIVARAKSKANLFKYMENFEINSADSTKAEKEMNEAISIVCSWFDIKTLSSTSAGKKFKTNLYHMLDKYTQTPSEIKELMDSKKEEVEKIVDIIMNDICKLPNRYKSDVQSSILNMVEKYFSISFPNKSIFTKERDAYPLKLNATDNEDSKVEQTAALEEPLQSKAIFFDNKKMLQQSESCDGITFIVNRKNTLYCSKKFRVKILIKSDHCTIKFTEYTMEEDIINVLFSLIDTSRNCES